MNFFKDKELALRFKNNEVPSKERFSYLIFGSVLGGSVASVRVNQVFSQNKLRLGVLRH